MVVRADALDATNLSNGSMLSPLHGPGGPGLSAKFTQTLPRLGSSVAPHIAELATSVRVSYARVRRDKGAIPIDAAWLAYWNAIVLAAQFANMVLLPIGFAWPCELSGGGGFAAFLFLIVDISGLLDVLITSITECKDEYGILITSPSEIRYRYFSDKGWLHCLCAIPWDVIPLAIAGVREAQCVPNGSFDLYRAWSILRLLRIVNLKKFLIFFGNVRIPGLHVCIAFQAWINRAGIGYETAEMVELPFQSRFLISFWAAEKSIFFVFRETETVAERTYCVIEALFAAVIYGSLFGNIASIIRFLDSSEAVQEVQQRHALRLGQMRRYMHGKAFPVELQKKVLDHENFRLVRNQGMDDSNLFKDLPRTLQVEIYSHLYLDLGTHPLFQTSIVLALRPVTVLPGWYVFREGDEAREMFFIQSGTVEVWVVGGTQMVNKLGPGKFFGEVALMEESKRSASIRAAETVELCVLNKTDFDNIVASHPAVQERLTKSIEERKKAEERALERMKKMEGGGKRGGKGRRESVLARLANRDGSDGEINQQGNKVWNNITNNLRKLSMIQNPDPASALEALTESSSQDPPHPITNNEAKPNTGLSALASRIPRIADSLNELDDGFDPRAPPMNFSTSEPQLAESAIGSRQSVATSNNPPPKQTDKESDKQQQLHPSKSIAKSHLVDLPLPTILSTDDGRISVDASHPQPPLREAGSAVLVTRGENILDDSSDDT
ncbi:hypothetical protein HDU93_006027 [Gonapodya sp. JEL0774]|nr:hypothetical protein HDU93_006027 [Gonapodya sp. JEL0774]